LAVTGGSGLLRRDDERHFDLGAVGNPATRSVLDFLNPFFSFGGNGRRIVSVREERVDKTQTDKDEIDLREAKIFQEVVFPKLVRRTYFVFAPRSLLNEFVGSLQ
jgi:hypothetical protein